MDEPIDDTTHSPHHDTPGNSGTTSEAPPEPRDLESRLRAFRVRIETLVRERPLAALGAAFGLGLLVAATPRGKMLRFALALAGEALVGRVRTAAAAANADAN